MSNLDLIRGRQTVAFLTNQSGGSVAAGDVVYLDTGHDESFITGTTANYTGAVGVAFESIASAVQGRVIVEGYCPLVNVNASVARGHYGATFTVAKQATDVGASRASGTVCQFLTGGTTPSAMLFAAPDVSVTTPASGINIARGKAYTLSPTPGDGDLAAQYLSTGGSSFAAQSGFLTDGWWGLPNGGFGTAAGNLGWSNVVGTIVLDLATAHSGTVARIVGTVNTSNAIAQPSAVKLEYSDDNITFTSVSNRTGLAVGSGSYMWFADVDISSSGSHRYWRWTLTPQTGDWVFASEVEFLT